MSETKRYRGRTPGEAMRAARAELGEEARLLSARRVSAPGLPAVYEVSVIASAPATTTAPAADGLAALRREVESLRASLAGIAPAAPAAEPDEDEDPWMDVLRRLGVSRSRAARLAGAAARAAGDTSDPLRPLRDELTAALGAVEISPDDLGDRSVVVVGPAGAGKTTVLARIAAEQAARGRSPVLVCADGESVAGEETLEAVASALGLRFETAFLDGQLAAIVERHGPSTTYLVDTTGHTPAERNGMDGLRALIGAVSGAELLAVLPATSDLEELRLLARAYATLGETRAVLTKLDELSRAGRLIDLAGSIECPLTWVTFGRSPRGTSAAPSDPRVVERVLGSAADIRASA